MMSSFFLLICFNGLDYYGSQKQPRGRKTIQGEIEKALDEIYHRPIKAKMVSRLDGQVSARRFGVGFEAEETISPAHLPYVLNRALPEDIRVLKSYKVLKDDSPRYEAEMKTYEYTLGLAFPDPLTDQMVYHPSFKFDKEIFKKIMLLYKGQHDFSCFYSPADKDGEMPFKIIEDVYFKEDSKYLKSYIVGHAFGRYQIRYLVGTAYMVACGRLEEDDVVKMLAGEKKTKLSFKAPSHALVLDDVTYKEGYLPLDA